MCWQELDDGGWYFGSGTYRKGQEPKCGLCGGSLVNPPPKPSHAEHARTTGPNPYPRRSRRSSGSSKKWF